LFFSDYIVDLLGLGSNRAAVGELMPLTREDYRTRIHNEFLSLKVGNHFDETFPVVLPEDVVGEEQFARAEIRLPPPHLGRVEQLHQRLKIGSAGGKHNGVAVKCMKACG